MKIDRLIGIIMILLQQEKVTAPELARRFEVSRRTIGRDIEDICRAGIPIITMQGYDGGIAIADSYKVDQTFFTQEEMEAVLYGLKGMDSVSKTSYFAKMVEKLSTKEHRILTDESIVIDLASHAGYGLAEKIDSIREAIRQKRLLSFRYFSPRGEMLRRIEPYRLFFKWSAWYVFGYCLDRQDFRLFKLNRLWEIAAAEPFSPREIPAEKLELDRYFAAEERFHLKAVFAEGCKYRLIEEYGVGCYKADGAGGLLFEWDFVDYANMREWIFSFGDQVTILAPEALRQDRMRQAKNILAQSLEK